VYLDGCFHAMPQFAEQRSEARIGQPVECCYE
jgi:hypothetical protein